MTAERAIKLVVIHAIGAAVVGTAASYAFGIMTTEQAKAEPGKAFAVGALGFAGGVYALMKWGG